MKSKEGLGWAILFSERQVKQSEYIIGKWIKCIALNGLRVYY